MPRSDQTIVVLGATGQQGGSVARALVRNGWPVRALVRDPASARASALRDQGIETVGGDLDDADTLRAALEGAYGTFSVQPSSGQPEYGIRDADEIRYGIAVANAAREAGVAHFVYSSVAGTGPATGVGHYDSKWRIEEHVRSQPLAWTVVRPAAFMEILLLPAFGLSSGTLTFFPQPEATMQFIAVEDIGRLVARVFEDRERFRGKTLELAGDGVTGNELAVKISTATARPIRYQRYPDSVLDEAPLLRQLVKLVNTGPAAGSADIEALQQLEPGLLDFDAWLVRTGAAAIRSAGPARG